MARGNKTIEEKYNSPFASNIRKLMSERGITQDELARAIGKTRQTVSQYVNGISEPGYSTLVCIADFFNVPVDFLLGRTEVQSMDSTIQSIAANTGLSEHSVISLISDTSDIHMIARLVNDILEGDNILVNHVLLVQMQKMFSPGKKAETEEERKLQILDELSLQSGLRQYGQTWISQTDYMRFLTSEIGNTIAESLRKKYIPGYKQEED